MRVQEQKTVPFGELVAAAFDGASRYSTDPLTVSLLATGAVSLMLQHSHRERQATRRHGTAGSYQST